MNKLTRRILALLLLGAFSCATVEQVFAGRGCGDKPCDDKKSQDNNPPRQHGRPRQEGQGRSRNKPSQEQDHNRRPTR